MRTAGIPEMVIVLNLVNFYLYLLLLKLPLIMWCLAKIVILICFRCPGIGYWFQWRKNSKSSDACAKANINKWTLMRVHSLGKKTSHPKTYFLKVGILSVAKDSVTWLILGRTLCGMTLHTDTWKHTSNVSQSIFLSIGPLCGISNLS